MEDEEVERILQESADKIQIMDFSERWKRIQNKLAAREAATQKEPVPEAVLANSANESVPANGGKRKVVYILCALFLAMVVCLAIVLPIVLKSNNEPTYFDFIELKSTTVSENEFYTNLEEADIDVSNFSKFECDLYVLLYTPDETLVGGKVEIVDESAGAMLNVCFYKSSVKSDFNIGEDFSEYSINNCNIEYKTEPIDSYYNTKAKATKSDLKYELDCISSEDNAIGFFQKVFG